MQGNDFMSHPVAAVLRGQRNSLADSVATLAAENGLLREENARLTAELTQKRAKSAAPAKLTKVVNPAAPKPAAT